MKLILNILFLFLTVLFAACKDDDDPKPVTPNPPPAEAKEDVIEIKTSHGTMYMYLYKETPLHRANFLQLADSGFYDSTTFHRCVTNFVIQGGDPLSKDSDPNNDGTGGPGYTIAQEIRDSIKNIRGSVATARQSNAVNPLKASNGSQFYINLVNNTSLNNEYTVFGFIMKGMDVADKIVAQPKNGANRPLTDIRMDVNILKKTKAEILAEYGYTVK